MNAERSHEQRGKNRGTSAVNAESNECLKHRVLRICCVRMPIAASLSTRVVSTVLACAMAWPAVAHASDRSAPNGSVHTGEADEPRAVPAGDEDIERHVAAHKEARRRKLTGPAAVTITLSAGLLLAGALLFAIKPREALASSTYRQERRDRAAIGLLAAGGVLAPAAITLGVLGFGQARRDAERRDHELETSGSRVEVSVAPQLSREGAGLGLAMRF
jgi:hypothetical protein